MVDQKWVAAVGSRRPGRGDARGASGDSGYGVFMFFVFIVAVLVVTVAVCVLAVIGSWWMLGVAIAVHVIVTTGVMAVVIGAFGPASDAYPDLEDAVPAPTPSAAGGSRDRRRRFRPPVRT